MNSVETIKVDYDGDLRDYEGYEWYRDNVTYIISSVTRLDGTFWKLGILVSTENNMDSYNVETAFREEFLKPSKVSIEITPAEYASLMDLCFKYDLRLNVKSIEE